MLFPGKEELGFVKHVTCFEMFYTNWLKYNWEQLSFQQFFGKKPTQQRKDNERCAFLLLCLFTTNNLPLYTDPIYKQEARGSLYSGWIYITDYAIKII